MAGAKQCSKDSANRIKHNEIPTYLADYMR